MTLAGLLAAHPVVLLDFDGPVCAVFGGERPAPAVAQELAEEGRARGIPLPDDVADCGDPFDVLHAAARFGARATHLIEHALRAAEVRAVRTAPITPGARDAIAALHSSGHTITIVSNNSQEAVQRFLSDHSLTHALARVAARTQHDPALLKPAPHLLTRATQAAGVAPDQCVLIGDSVTDVAAARAAGTAVIAYANKPGKRDTFTALYPDAIIDTMDQLTRAATSPSVV